MWKANSRFQSKTNSAYIVFTFKLKALASIEYRIAVQASHFFAFNRAQIVHSKVG